jgi:TnpA family transposase
VRTMSLINQSSNLQYYPGLRVLMYYNFVERNWSKESSRTVVAVAE